MSIARHMMSDLQLRVAERTDAFDLARLMDCATDGEARRKWKCQAGPGHDPIVAGANAILAIEDEFHIANSHLLYVGDRLVGFMLGYGQDQYVGHPEEKSRYAGPWARASYFVAQLAVFPAWRGRGFAQLLLEHAEHLARKQRLKQVSLTVASGNRHAFGLYERIGFRDLGPELFPGGEIMWKMIKRIRQY